MIYDRGIAARVNGKVYKMILMYGLKMVAQTNGQEAELKTSTFPLEVTRFDRITNEYIKRMSCLETKLDRRG